jgi:hypothetical protein
METVMKNVDFGRVLNAVIDADMDLDGCYDHSACSGAASMIHDRIKETDSLSREDLAQIIREAFDAHLECWGQASLGYMLADLLH